MVQFKSIISETTCYMLKFCTVSSGWLQRLLQISSISEMVHLESVRKFVELTQNGCLFLL